ncbi:MAG: class I SAM-dependent methyltransferase [Sulfuricaulis sp.]|uniref:class I SAM-dependent methyltransferase n=1 Tax=Sulfuricaulis sp. TaxID=2003553 RepID=UPI0025E0F5D7|nr:class I SAM-dependent methyltransferase [Sulfuricaulis sp.]MCR4347473.1 class I SAM-dependent methyltransferase [Sulfuricaulis sp.]
MINAFLRHLRTDGLRGTLAALIDFSQHLWRRWADASFDRRYGTDTQGITDDMTELGVFTEHRLNAFGYEGIQIPVFQKMLRELKLDPSEYAFVDFGSGKGRALMMAAEYGFARTYGVEFSPVLHEIAQKNIAIFGQRNPRACPIELRLQDAMEFSIPDENLVCFFYNPFDDKVMRQVVGNIADSYARHPRKLAVAYRNPLCAELFDNLGFLQLVSSTHRYHIYKSR